MSNPIGGTLEDINEAIVKPVADGVGQAIEVGTKSVTGQTLTPQQIQQKQEETQNKLSDARRRIKYWQDLAEAQRRVREEEKQKQMQNVQAQQVQIQQRTMEISQKKRVLPAALASRNTTESKKGIGG
jgi:hypothetical protein